MAAQLDGNLPETAPAAVVALSVEVAAGGYSIARAVAQRLGYAYYDWEVTSRATALAGLPADDGPADGPLFDRVIRRLTLANVLESELPPVLISGSFRMNQMAAESLSSEGSRHFIEQVVSELASAGRAVIVGHGACVTLKDGRDVLKVLVRASVENRARRLIAEQGGSLSQAIDSLERADRLKQAYIRDAYKADWRDLSLYDLVINTDRLSAEAAADCIAAAAQAGATTPRQLRPRRINPPIESIS